jgi:hypothetical protein
MTKATKAKLDTLSQKVNLQVAGEEGQASKLKIVLIVVVGALAVVFFMAFRKRRK